MNLKQLVLEVLIEQLEEMRKEYDKQMDKEQLEREYIKYRQLAEKYKDCLEAIRTYSPKEVVYDDFAYHRMIDSYRQAAASALNKDYESSLDEYEEKQKPNTTFDEHDGC